MLAMGEFGMDNFEYHPQVVLVYTFFFAATFISQLTMLNMLVAIMADSFDRVYENRKLNSIKMKLQLAFDYRADLRHVHFSRNDYLFVGQKLQDDDEDGDGDEWEGTIRRLTRKIHRSTDTVKNMVT